MNRLTVRVASLMAVACLAVLGNAAAADAAKVVRLGTLAPKGSSYYRHLQAMGEKWRAAPGGGAQLTIYPDGTMGSEADMIRRMRLGQLQAGMVTTVGLSEIDLGVAGLQSMPKMFRNLAEVDYVQEKLGPALDKRLEAKGFVVLCWSDTGFVKFFSKQAVVTPEDLTRTKLFVSASRASETECYRFVGCHPVPLEVADILPGLQTGLIDCVAMPPTIALAMQLDGAAPHMLEMNWAPLVGALIITKKAWDGIPEASREAVREAAREAGKEIKADGRRESAEAVEAMRKRGLTVHTLTPELDTAWDRQVERSYPKVRGLSVPEEIFDLVVAQLKEFRAQPGGAPK